MAQTAAGHLVYIVEDDTDIREIELYTLRSQGMRCEGFGVAKDFFLGLERQAPDLVLLDVMLPDMSGTDVLSRLKASQKTERIPVIMATARGAEFERVKTLNAGADDYLVKPFSMLEMAARINAVLRRTASFAPQETTYGPITLDAQKRSVKVDGKGVELSKKEFDILELLLEQPGRVLSRETILNRLWDDIPDSSSRTVDVHIGTLRTKLKEAGKLIRTVHGVGYKLEL